MESFAGASHMSRHTEAQPTPELLLQLSDLVAGFHECQFGGQWALVGEAVEDISIRSGQILVVIARDGETKGDDDLQPDLVLLAGPPGMRLGTIRVVEVEPPA
jgi:hypothetical protein